jgi:hypothetical protein
LQPLSCIQKEKHGSFWSTESGGQGRLLASIEADGGLDLGEAEQPSFGALAKVRNASTTCTGSTVLPPRLLLAGTVAGSVTF